MHEIPLGEASKQASTAAVVVLIKLFNDFVVPFLFTSCLLLLS